MSAGRPTIQVEFQGRVEKQVAKAGGKIPDAFVGMVEKVQGMTLTQLNQDKGLNWEKLTGKRDPGTKLQLWSLRINNNWRALCVLRTGPVIEIRAVREHDKAY